MKHTIKSEVLHEALSRCITVKDGYSISFSEHNGRVFATFSASDSTSCSNITILAEPGSAGSKQFKVGTDFAGAAKALCQAGEYVVFDIQDDYLELQCGGASVRIKYKTQVMTLEMNSPRKDAYASFEIKAKEFKRLVQQSCFAYGSYDETSRNAPFNFLFLLPCVNESSCGIRAVTSNAYFGASSSALVVNKDDKFVEMAQNSKGFCLSPQSAKSLVSVLKKETIAVYVFDKQLLVKDGNDVFAFILSSVQFPVQVFSVLDNQECDYSFEAKLSDLKIALNITSVNNTDINKAAMFLEIDEHGVTLRSCENGNHAPVSTVNKNGVVKVACSIKQFKDIINTGITEVDTLVISGFGNGAPIHIRGGHCNAFTLPIALDSNDSSPAESSSK